MSDAFARYQAATKRFKSAEAATSTVVLRDTLQELHEAFTVFVNSVEERAREIVRNPMDSLAEDTTNEAENLLRSVIPQTLSNMMNRANRVKIDPASYRPSPGAFHSLQLVVATLHTDSAAQIYNQFKDKDLPTSGFDEFARKNPDEARWLRSEGQNVAMASPSPNPPSSNPPLRVSSSLSPAEATEAPGETPPPQGQARQPAIATPLPGGTPAPAPPPWLRWFSVGLSGLIGILLLYYAVVLGTRECRGDGNVDAANLMAAFGGAFAAAAITGEITVRSRPIGVAKYFTAFAVGGFGLLLLLILIKPFHPVSSVEQMRCNATLLSRQLSGDDITTSDNVKHDNIDFNLSPSDVRNFFNSYCQQSNSGNYAICSFTSKSECVQHLDASPAGPFKSNHHCVEKPTHAYCFGYSAKNGTPGKSCVETKQQCESSQASFRQLPNIAAVGTCDLYGLN